MFAALTELVRHRHVSEAEPFQNPRIAGVLDHGPRVYVPSLRRRLASAAAALPAWPLPSGHPYGRLGL